MNDVLNETQIGVAKSAISNIEDKLASIKNEIYTVEKPHKSYLNEKIDSIYWDVKVLVNMCKQEEEED